MTFEQLYRAYAPDVRRFALYLTGDPAETDDLVSETFVRAWAADAPIRARSLRAYLFAVVRNLHRQRLRRARRWLPWSPAAEAVADPAPGAEASAESRDALGRTLAALRALPEPDRAALLMRGFHELGYDEIGQALGISPGAAKVRVHRARKLLEARKDMP